MTHRVRAAGDRAIGRLSRAPRWVLTLVVALVCVGWVGTVWGTWFAWDIGSSLPDRQSIRSIGDMAQATTIYDAHDRPVFQIYKEQRIEIPLARMSPLLIKAIIAIEDQRFYEHRGVDAVRTVGAVLANLREGRRAQGGSTITQQLARQSFLSRDKTVRRKLKEMILAARLELTYSKQEILELYLNKVYFGDGLYGVEAASLGYFGRHAADLTLPEAALLAGLVQSPSRYAPTVSLERAVNRRNTVLQTMRDSGAITTDEYAKAHDAVPQIVDRLRREESHGQYFKEMVRQMLVEKFGWQRVYQGGLRVYTTIEPAEQEAAERIVADQLEQLEAQRAKEQKAKRGKDEAPPADEPPLQAALVSLDPATGAVRALVGGRDFETSRFNRAVQARRQPGSAFKPFVYAAAIENGFSPASVVDRLDEPVMTLQGEWVPEDEHTDVSEMTLRTALRTSSNRAAVRLLEEVGIDRTVAYAKELGVGSVPSVPSLALGSGEVTLLSMTAAYASFDNHGELPTPMFVRKVEDDEGTVLFEQAPVTRRVISDTTAYLMSSMLADVVNYGTAYKARRVGFTLPAAGKTGTTNDFVDAWFVGFTPKLVTGVWVGFDRPRSILRSGYAGDVAVPLWARYMKEATKGDKPEWFTPPKGIVGVNVCRLSGKLPNTGCDAVEVVDDEGQAETRSMIYTEYFVRGTQPTQLCPLHPGVSVLGHIAGLFGKEGQPPASAEQLGLLARRPAAPPAATPTTGHVETTPAPVAAQQAEPKKKRGFWSRVFGLGRDDDSKDKKDQPDSEQPQNATPQR